MLPFHNASRPMSHVHARGLYGCEVHARGSLWVWLDACWDRSGRDCTAEAEGQLFFMCPSAMNPTIQC
jgi:hypothetical protein